MVFHTKTSRSQVAAEGEKSGRYNKAEGSSSRKLSA